MTAKPVDGTGWIVEIPLDRGGFTAGWRGQREVQEDGRAARGASGGQRQLRLCQETVSE